MTMFMEVVFPVVVVFFIGYVVQKWKKVDIKSVSTVAIYVLTPSLVFHTFYTAELNLQYLYMIIFAFILLMTMILINKIYARIKNYDASLESGLILATSFMNSGNYGAPIILFAYGQTGFSYAVSYMVLQSLLMNFFGVYYAARGGAGVIEALKAVFKMPATYAVIAALAMNFFHIPMPGNLLMTVELISAASIPVVMLILGMQLAEITLENFEWGKIAYGVVMRLFLSPVIAYFITLFLPLDPLLTKVLIVSAAMPTAAMIVIYAVQFNAKPKLVASITFITTLVSIATITILLYLLD